MIPYFIDLHGTCAGSQFYFTEIEYSRKVSFPGLKSQSLRAIFFSVAEYIDLFMHLYWYDLLCTDCIGNKNIIHITKYR